MHTLPCSSAAAARTGRPRGVSAATVAARDRIAACVARDFALAESEVMAKSRGAPRAALARQVAMYLAHVACGLDFAAVGRLFRRDRTTVSHACRVVEDLRDDAWFDRRVAALERACRAGRGRAAGEVPMKRPRLPAGASAPEIGAARARHLRLAARELMTETGLATVTVNDGESPLAWLARRKGRDGQPLIAPVQFLAGERLRADFTRASLGPRVTASWAAPVSRGSGASGGPGQATDAMVAARQRFQTALKACGPEFSGLLTDVCCFLQRLEDVEAARGWPARSAKVVLQLALDRLARHYGLRGEIHGPAQARLRAWAAADEEAG